MLAVVPACEAQNSKLDVNDVSILWPLPVSEEDVKQLISADELLADAGQNKLWREDFFNKVIATAGEVKVSFEGDESKIRFALPELRQAHAWKVAGIRINPSQLGTHEEILKKVPEIPGVRLVMQPVTVKNGKAVVHDVAAHVVFNIVKPSSQPPGFEKDKEAFSKIVEGARKLKKAAEMRGPTSGALRVHPALKADLAGFSQEVRAFMRDHLKSAQLSVVSFMGIDPLEPWIFFRVMAKPTGLELDPKVAQGFKFGGEIVPKTTTPGQEITTALLFVDDVKDKLNTPALPGTQTEALKTLLLKDVADRIANPNFHNTLNMDCVSCHTETTLRKRVPIAGSSPGLGFQRAGGVKVDVDTALLPSDQWNLRNFGWGFNFFENQTFAPTITQRAANEAFESVDYINIHYPAPAAPVGQ